MDLYDWIENHTETTNRDVYMRFKEIVDRNSGDFTEEERKNAYEMLDLLVSQI